MLAANVDFGILKLIAAAAVGVVLWWQQRKSKQADEELEKRVRENDRAAGGPTRSFPAPSAPPLETPEQEKLRRFLEALGVPSGQQPAPPPPPVRPVAPPVAPASSPYRPAQVEPPKRPVVRQPVPRPVVVATPVRRLVAVDPEPEPMESRDAGHLVESSQEMMQAARYDAVPIPQISVSVATPPAQNTRPGTEGLASLQRALHSVESLRTAYLLKEILGAPKSLQ
jgi:hypothetical protein